MKYYIFAVAALLFMLVIGIFWVGEDISRMQIFLGLLAVAVSGFAVFFFLRSRGQGVVERRYFHVLVVMAGFAWAVFALYSVNFL